MYSSVFRRNTTEHGTETIETSYVSFLRHSVSIEQWHTANMGKAGMHRNSESWADAEILNVFMLIFVNLPSLTVITH